MAGAFRRGMFGGAAVALPAGLLAAGMLSAHAAGGFPAHYAAPYPQISGADAGDMAADRNATGLKYYTLAFLTPKSGCTPMWEDGGDPVGAFTSQVKAVQAAGGDVIISFGGAPRGGAGPNRTPASPPTPPDPPPGNTS